MFHIDLSSKRSQLALRFFTYGVMTLATIILTTAAVFYAMGYRFNQNDLSFEQGGLLQFMSAPSGAQVYVNGVAQSIKTPGRMSVKAGEQIVEMQLNGYNAWRKTVTIAPGQLMWLNYARLIPTSVTTSSIVDLPSVSGGLMSPDHKWMVLQTSSAATTLKLVDLGDPKKPLVTDLVIPEDQLTKKDGAFGQFTIKEWDLGSRYLLVEHINKDVHEILRVDRERGAATVNATKLFSLNIADAHFAGSNANVLYVKTDSVVRSLDIGSNSASAALISGVEQFTMYGNGTIAFVALRDVGGSASKQRVVGVYTNSKETIARTYSADAQVLIAYTEYTHHAYLAITTGDGVAKILRDPTATNGEAAEVGQLKIAKPLLWLKFSGNGRILAANNGNDIATYDLDLDTTASWALSGAAVTRPLQWLDDYYLWTDAGGTLRIFEYDGNNDHPIAAVTEGVTAGLSADGAYLFSIAQPKDAKTALQSSQLIKN